jgi:2-amino-4-hydroxy-6-hydroxymethyldihydropteridine diphosphokinase
MALAYIGLGANMPSVAGSPAATLTGAAEHIAASGRVIARSSLYSTTPVGYEDQPRFVNAVVGIDTQLAPRDLLNLLLGVEREFGRDRTNAIVNGPRTLDLDILLYDDLIVSEAGLEIPHPRLAEREFVLVPLNEIAPEARDPRSGNKVQELFGRLTTRLPRASNQEQDAVVAIESECWRAGVARASGNSGVARTTAGLDPDHG